MRVYPPIDLSMLLTRRNLELFFHKKSIPIPDCIIPRIGQRKPSYTLSVIRQFEMLKVSSLNASQAIGRSRDKLRALQILSQHNIGIPRTFFLDSMADIEVALDHVGKSPFVIKIPEGTQGTGVILAESVRSARSILESLLAQGRHVLVQEFIAESNGNDVRVIILGGRLVAAMRREAAANDFRSNLHRGGHHSKIELSVELKKTAQIAARALGLQFAGVDLIESNDGPLVLEVNSSPGLEGIEAASGENVAAACIRYVEKMQLLKNKGDSIGY